MRFGVMTLFDYYPEDRSPNEYYQFLLDEMVYAEELGFDTAWLGEHHFCNYLCPSPQIFATALAERTTRMRIGTSVALLPLHDPVRPKYVQPHGPSPDCVETLGFVSRNRQRRPDPYEPIRE